MRTDNSKLDAQIRMAVVPREREMPIPKSRGEVIFQSVITVVVVFFALLAMVNLCSGVGLIASIIWLALVTMMIWTTSKRDGGLRRFLINRMGELFGSRFVESYLADAQPGAIGFGFQLLGHRFIQQCIPLDRIESVEWNTGQATDMAGRDMNDWRVWIWYDHNDPTKAEEKRKWRHPKAEQDLYGVGPSTRKDRAEVLGLSLVAFLRNAGADLIQGTTTTCFVKRRRDGGEKTSIQPEP